MGPWRTISLLISERSLDTSRTPRLTRRFALYAALALLAASISMFLFVREEVTHRAEQTGRFHTKFIADSILRAHLTPADLRSPVLGARRGQLDRLFREEILIGGGLRANVYGPDGRIMFSTDHSLIGTRPDEPDNLEAALRGELVSDVTRLGAEDDLHGGIKVLETYVPLTLRSGVRGVFELYENYAPIAASAQQLFVPLTAVIAAVLLLLYISFFPILRRVTARITHQAFHDELTGLPNRALFHDRVNQTLAMARRYGGSVAVMLLDLDRFKDLNDTLGHQSGDRLLQEVGADLTQALRESDTVARLGGDEFALLVPAPGSPDDALAVAERALRGIRRPRQVSGVEVDVDASIGIALYPEHGQDVETLLRQADIAMYVSKESGAPTLFAPDHDHHSAEQLALVAQLRRAINRREITVYYQPQADFRTGTVRSVEALVRWQHPERGLLPPDVFIPLAEHTGMIRALTSHVLDTALEQHKSWRENGLDLGVAVNITGRDLLDLRFAEEVESLLSKWAVEPSRLELEITENTVFADPSRAREVLCALSGLGIRLAIDDFGSGNSSLGYLKRLPIDVLKIDKSFVLGMDASDDDAIIVQSTIDLGHNLGLKVIAEGVETQAAWGQLQRLGCDIAQGYFLSRPVPPSDITSIAAHAGAITAIA